MRDRRWRATCTFFMDLCARGATIVDSRHGRAPSDDRQVAAGRMVHRDGRTVRESITRSRETADHAASYRPRERPARIQQPRPKIVIHPLFRVLLVDDEPLARQELRRLLSDCSDRLEVVDEVSTIASASAAIVELEPDLMLLDITLPDGNRVQWLSALDTAPHVVFVTAHQSYVFRALELNAWDYLLKPVTATRLATTMARMLPSLEATALARGAPVATPAMEAASHDEGGETASRPLWHCTIGAS